MEENTELSPLALAFLGDSIHTTYVRLEVLSQPKNKLENYHQNAKSHCSAISQAKVLDKLTPLLTPEETEVVRRARNAKNKHTAKNCDEKTYKKATSFEALIGWLYVTDQKTRLTEILKFSMQENEEKR